MTTRETFPPTPRASRSIGSPQRIETQPAPVCPQTGAVAVAVAGADAVGLAGVRRAAVAVSADTDGGAELLEEAGGLPVDLYGDTGLRVSELVEGDHAGVLGVAVLDGPRDALVRVLLGDDRAELTLLARDLDGPVGGGVVDLVDLLHLVEEVGELLEASPLVVGLTDGDVDVDGFDDLRHVPDGRPIDLGGTQQRCPPATPVV